MNHPVPAVDEQCLQERLDRLRTSYANHDALVRELEGFVRNARDDQLLRINPIRYAAEHARDETQVIELFLHARKAGLVTMEWHYVCRGCGMIIESFHTLNAAGAHAFCKTCLVNRDTDLSDFVEIGFTVSKAVRTSRFHAPERLSAKELAIDYNISASAMAADGTTARDFYWRHNVFLTYVEPGESTTFQVNLEPGFFALQHGPELRIDPLSNNRLERIDITHRDDRPAEKMQTVAPRPLTCHLTNASPARIIAGAISFSAAEVTAFSGVPHGFTLGGFLSGSRRLSTQTFLDLFPSETVMSAGGLAVNGALVKTIGDAVMASFHEPLDAIRAALEMLAQIKRFNHGAGEELITLKIGAHVGPCLAVTLNERLDYFGRTVNLAARVQALAAENEIYLSDEIYRLPGAADLLTAMRCDPQTVRVKGIEREIAVHALRPRP